MLGHRPASADYQIRSSATLIPSTLLIQVSQSLLKFIAAGGCDRTCSITEETEYNTGNYHYRTVSVCSRQFVITVICSRFRSVLRGSGGSTSGICLSLLLCSHRHLLDTSPGLNQWVSLARRTSNWRKVLLCRHPDRLYLLYWYT